mmetsp:Transcript_9681/g.30699  ORF Transcript_9681/g.30699 Transcript_9681/m.30699 type:complete len:740 (+) Transcript_9681:2288-4507(+)
MGAPAEFVYKGQCQIMSKLESAVTVTADGDSAYYQLLLEYDSQNLIIPSSTTAAATADHCAGGFCILMPRFRANVYLDDTNIEQRGDVFVDSNADGQRGEPEDELGLAGAVLTLTIAPDGQHDWDLNTGRPDPHPIATTEAGLGKGAWLFERYTSAFKANGDLLLAPDAAVNLRPDTRYSIVVTLPEDKRALYQPGAWIEADTGTPNFGGALVYPREVNSIIANTDVRDREPTFADAYRTFTAPALNGQLLDLNIGFVPVWTLGDYVFEDKDRDGLQSATDVGIGDITINLWDISDPEQPAFLGFTVSHPDGSFAFPSNVVRLLPGMTLSMRVDLGQPNIVRPTDPSGPLIPAEPLARREPAPDDSKLILVDGESYAHVLVVVPSYGSGGGGDFDIGFTTFDCGELGECSGHGSCVSSFECECEGGWAGPSCNIDPDFDPNSVTPPPTIAPTYAPLPDGLTPCGDGRVLDYCGVCGGNGVSCEKKKKKKGVTVAGIQTPFNMATVYGIVGGVVFLIVVVVVARRVRKQKERKAALEQATAMTDMNAARQAAMAGAGWGTGAAAAGTAYPNQYAAAQPGGGGGGGGTVGQAYAPAGAAGGAPTDATGSYAATPANYDALQMQSAMQYGAPPTTGDSYGTSMPGAGGTVAYGMPPTADPSQYGANYDAVSGARVSGANANAAYGNGAGGTFNAAYGNGAGGTFNAAYGGGAYMQGTVNQYAQNGAGAAAFNVASPAYDPVW